MPKEYKLNSQFKCVQSEAIALTGRFFLSRESSASGWPTLYPPFSSAQEEKRLERRLRKRLKEEGLSDSDGDDLFGWGDLPPIDRRKQAGMQ